VFRHLRPLYQACSRGRSSPLLQLQQLGILALLLLLQAGLWGRSLIA
jgi:hypothetical protein